MSKYKFEFSLTMNSDEFNPTGNELRYKKGRPNVGKHVRTSWRLSALLDRMCLRRAKPSERPLTDILRGGRGASARKAFRVAACRFFFDRPSAPRGDDSPLFIAHLDGGSVQLVGRGYTPPSRNLAKATVPVSQ